MSGEYGSRFVGETATESYLMGAMTRWISKLVFIGLTMASTPASPAANAVDISAKSLGGQSFVLSEQRGLVVIVNFWATWCAPCKVEMPALDAYYRRHHSDGLSLLAISIDTGASIRKLQDQTLAYSFPIARLDDTRMPRSAIPTALPETRVYDKQGILRYDSAAGKTHAPLDEATLERVVTPLLTAGVTTR